MSGETTKAIAEKIIAELEHFRVGFKPEGGPTIIYTQRVLQQEPFIGFAAVQNKQGRDEILLICRHYTPLRFRPRHGNTDFASYLSPLGRIIAKQPGQIHEFAVKHHTGFVWEQHKYRLIQKDEFRPLLTDGKWDAIENRMAWIDERVLVPSLLRLLAGEVTGAERRAARVSVQLPDQAILDGSQDDVFRMPLNRRVRISGAPGTGKTTVLVKRLSQKTKFDFLTDEEKQSIPREAWNEGQNWVLFTPNDLLKAYLKEALAKELLPAGDHHVKVYSTFRLEVLRDIGFVRVGQHGFFRIAGDAQQLLKRTTGSEHVKLTKAFRSYLGERFATAYQEALQEFNNATRKPLGQLADLNQKILVTALDIVAKSTEDIVELRVAQRRAAGYRKLNEDIGKIIQTVRGVGELHEKSQGTSVREIRRQAQQLLDVLPRISTEESETALFPEVEPLVASMRKAIRDVAEAVALLRLFQLIPRAYQEFREIPDTQERYFAADVQKAIADRLISGPEQDVLLLSALDFVRELTDSIPADFTGVPDPVRYLLGKMRLIVAVDEVTDFSVVEVACMDRLASPRTNGVTICGDLMQRVTLQGLKRWDEMDELLSSFDSCELNVSYRQTNRLFSLARDLYKHVTGEAPPFRSAYPDRPEDPPPLSVKTTEDLPVDQWLTERVIEIFELCGNHLPSTAILVPVAADVTELHRKLQPRLREHAIEVDASHTGQSLGDSARVRIFPVDCIKGLEFEAVFYIGLDRMAEIHRELVDKYLYVGLSRARSFLGVTYERQFPQRLQPIAGHFVQRASFQE